jgi:methionyl-tRNA formyltransferase
VKIIYFGTPFFAAEVLRYLLDQGVEVVAVVTQPDRPKGRSLQLTASPVKTLITERALKIPILQPEKASQESFLEELFQLKANLFVVVAFGQILPQKLLDIPPLGCINVHASLLPKYRGAAPIQRCLMAAEEETGISIQKMVRQLDAGDVIAESKISLSKEITFGELEQELIQLTGPLLLDVIHQYKNGIPNARPQDSSQVTYASKIELEEGEINWTLPADTIHNLIRAFSPKPGAWAWIQMGEEKKRLKILRSSVVSVELSKAVSPGAWMTPGVVYCGKNALKLIEVQLEGKKVMRADDWLRGCLQGQKNIYFVLN